MIHFLLCIAIFSLSATADAAGKPKKKKTTLATPSA